MLVTLLVGANQASFYEQQAAAKLNLPMASSVKVGQAYEHKRFKPPALKDMYVTANYVEEVDSPGQQRLQEALGRPKFPGRAYINDRGDNAYDAIYLYKSCVEKAESTKQAKTCARRRSTAAASAPTAVREGVHRPEEPAHEPPHLADPRQGGSLGGDSQGSGMNPALLAGQDRLRPDQEGDPKTQYTPSNLPKK